MSDKIAENIIPLLRCALGTDSHICNEPIVLTCSHCICKSCLPLYKDHNEINCNICQQQNQRNLNEPIKPRLFESLLDTHISDIFNVLVENFSKTLDNCKELVFNFHETFDMRVELVRDQIQLRIECLKVELDDLNDKFNKKLDKIKSDSKRMYSNTINSDKIDIDNFSLNLEEYRNVLSKQQELTAKDVYECQDKIRQLNNIIKFYKDDFPSIEFQCNNVSIRSDFIGELISKVKEEENLNKKVIKKLKEFKEDQFNFINLSTHKPYSFCVLPNSTLLVCNCNNAELCLYNQNFRLRQVIRTINDETFHVLDLDSNNRDAIYLCSFVSGSSGKTIVKIDMNFNKLAVFNKEDNQITSTFNPFGICYNRASVYACDFYNKRIVKLTENLAFDKVFDLNYGPWYIKIIETIACIRESVTNSIHFHDTKTFCEIRRYDGHAGVIGTSKFYFYEFDHSNKTFYCYNNNGELLEEIQLNITNGNTCSNGSICVFDSKLLICNIDFDKIIKIDCSDELNVDVEM